MFALLYDANGVIQQRMSAGSGTVQATVKALGLMVLSVPTDAAYERTHRVRDGKLVEIQNG